MDRKKKAVIIEPSSIVRKGLLSILNNIGIHTTDSGDKDTADILLSKEKPDYIIVNPFFINNNFVNQFRSKKNDYDVKTIALLT